jgi:hypothetical protein
MWHPIEHAILDQLEECSKGERFSLPESSDPVLYFALRSELRGANPVEGMALALKLAEALDVELESPSAAARIRALLQREPEAVRLIREHVLEDGGLDETRLFMRGEGRDAILSAPQFGEREPENATPLRNFLNPVNGRSVPRVVAGADSNELSKRSPDGQRNRTLDRSRSVDRSDIAEGEEGIAQPSLESRRGR